MINGQRRVLGGLILGARLTGVLLIALAVLCLPGMEFLTGRYTRVLSGAGSVVLLIVGIAWLFGVSMLVRFFDSYLSRH